MMSSNQGSSQNILNFKILSYNLIFYKVPNIKLCCSPMVKLLRVAEKSDIRSIMSIATIHFVLTNKIQKEQARFLDTNTN